MSQSTNTMSAELEGDALQVRLLIEWAASAGVEITSLAVGSCQVNLAPRRVPREISPQDQVTARSIYEKFGGKPYADIASKREVDGEYEPAIGRR